MIDEMINACDCAKSYLENAEMARETGDNEKTRIMIDAALSEVVWLRARLAALEAAAKADPQTAEYQPVCPDCSTPYPCKCMTS